jgi:hypothetical protein
MPIKNVESKDSAQEESLQDLTAEELAQKISDLERSRDKISDPEWEENGKRLGQCLAEYKKLTGKNHPAERSAKEPEE